MIKVEKAINDRKCHDCGTKIPAGTHCTAVFMKATSRSFCARCVFKVFLELSKHHAMEESKNEMLEANLSNA